MQQRFKTIEIFCIAFFICLSLVSYKNGQGQHKSSSLTNANMSVLTETMPATNIPPLPDFTNNSEISNMSLSIPATANNLYQSIIYMLTHQ